ncbi:MAG: hypothetical protein GWM90_10585, partial [Gemmatimonadetes bacterium]|nr:hypothetical protein [Gemmatimonadota bacterium]NIU74612.1 hypothetical protein [Gammaproteobacteria bacterium]NIX44543.1 hypothetical protein [Gemmatimonadota bacterium]
ALTQRLNKALDDLGTMASQVGLEEVSQLAGHARARLQASGANAVMALLPTIREAMAAAPPPEPEPEDEAETPGVEGFQPFG